MKPYIKHIGRKNATPAACPVCGKSSTDINAADIDISTSDLGSILRAYFSSPQYVYSDSPQPGVITWYYKCYHINPISGLTYLPPFYDLIK